MAASTAAAQIVLRAEDRRFLEPFLGRELGPAEAAREAGVSVEQMAYRVRALYGKGLLRVSGQRSRKGRVITLYRAAPEIRVPLDLLPYADVREFFALADRSLREVFWSSLARLADRSSMGDWVIRLYRSADGTVRLDLAPAGGEWDLGQLLTERAPAVAFHWVPLAVTRAEAKELQRELTALLGRYPIATDTPSHLLGLFLTPVVE